MLAKNIVKFAYSNSLYIIKKLIENLPIFWRSIKKLITKFKINFNIIHFASKIIKYFISGMEVSRSYTPVPPCLHPDDIAPNYKSDCLCLMIKRYPQGALSPSITALQIGQTFLLSNALGAFVIESFDRYSVIHMLAGGTGLTAMLGIIQRALARRSVSVSLTNH